MILFSIGGKLASEGMDFLDIVVRDGPKTPEQIALEKQEGHAALVLYIVHTIGLLLLAIGGLIHLWFINCRKHSFVDSVGKALLFARAGMLFLGIIVTVIMIVLVNQNGGTEPPNFSWIVIPSMSGLALSQILLAVVSHKNVSVVSQVERPRLVNRIFYGFEIACWTGIVGLSFFLIFSAIFQMSAGMGTVFSPRSMIVMAQLQTHAVANVVCVFIALVTIVNALMTPNLARLQQP